MSKRSRCSCCSDWWYESAYKRQEFRHAKAGPEEIPAKDLRKKKNRDKKKVPRHKHDWEIVYVNDWFTNSKGEMDARVKCVVCQKEIYMWI
jgi:hypothetical protein